MVLQICLTLDCALRPWHVEWDAKARTWEAPMPKGIQRITPFLWFDDQAEAAANFYVSFFKNSKIGSITRYDEEASTDTARSKESILTVAFDLNASDCTILNCMPLLK